MKKWEKTKPQQCASDNSKSQRAGALSPALLVLLFLAGVAQTAITFSNAFVKRHRLRPHDASGLSTPAGIIGVLGGMAFGRWS
jgi:hypothetical protein